MPTAAVIPAPGQPVELRDLRSPEMEAGSVLLKTLYSEVCGTDVYLQQGRLEGVPYPLIPGHVSVGEVIEIQGNVDYVDGKSVRIGDVVTFLDVHKTCNHCWYCLVAKAATRCPERKVYGITYGADEGLLGGWCEQVYLKPGVKLIRLPDSVAPRQLMAAGCSLPTALHAIDRAEIRLGDTVVVQGSGPVGISGAILSRLSGAGKVIVIDSRPNRLEVARRTADDTIHLDPSVPHDTVEQVLELTDGRGADITIEATGAPAAVKQGAQMTRDGGRYVVVGHYTDHGEVCINPHTEINRKHLEIRGTWGSDFSHFYRMVQLLERFGDDQRMGATWDTMVSGVYRLDQMNDALAAVAAGDVVKAIVQPGP